MTYTLQHRDSLLNQLSEQLAAIEKEHRASYEHKLTSLEHYEVHLFVGKDRVVVDDEDPDGFGGFGITQALGYFVNDVYWNAAGDWRDADRIEIVSI